MSIDYADGPFMNTAGTPVKPPGTAYLRVRFHPAWIVDVNAPNAPLTYTGPHVITPTGTHVVRGLALYDSFEAMVGWIIGLDGTHPIEVDAGPGKVTITVSARRLSLSSARRITLPKVGVAREQVVGLERVVERQDAVDDRPHRGRRR